MLRVRASPAEMQRWKARAREAGIPLSELARQALGRVHAWAPVEAEAHRERTMQIARIGSNLNQIARWANSCKSNADAVQVIARLVDLDRAVNRLAGK